MRDVVFKNRCNRDLKRMLKRGKQREDLLAIARMIATDELLPTSAHPHKLSGEYGGKWECHIEPDWLLIYGITNSEVILERTGTHADLFE